MRGKPGWVLHGMTHSREYCSWYNMRGRCYNKSNPGYSEYGGRGIKICRRWQGRYGFVRFYEDMGTRPEGTSLDRIDNDGWYTPENCRWATRAQQQRNLRSNRWLTYEGETMTVKDWATKLCLNPNTLTKRLNNGWATDAALTKPINTSMRSGKARLT